MLHIIKNYKNLFITLLENKLNNNLNFTDLDLDNSNDISLSELNKYNKESGKNFGKELLKTFESHFNVKMEKKHGINKEVFKILVNKMSEEDGKIALNNVNSKNTISNESKKHLNNIKSDISINNDYSKLTEGGNLKEGDKGNRVILLKTFLATKGYIDINSINSKFDKNTLKGLTNYLRNKGYKGKVEVAGKTTFNFIKEDLSNEKKQVEKPISKEKKQNIKQVQIQDKKSEIQKDNIENKATKLKIKAKRYFEGNDHTEKYDVYLKKEGDKYRLSVDDWGDDTYKIFDKKPTDNEIASSILAYNTGDKEGYENGWENIGYTPEQKITKFKEVKTKQSFGDTEGTFGHKLNIEDFRNDIDLPSFSNMIRNMNNSEMGNFIKQINMISKENNLGEDGRYHYNPANISELKDIFKEKGYEHSGIWFDGQEMGSLISLIESLYITQKNIPEMSKKDKVRLLLDFDRNGYLQTEKNFNVGEKQMDYITFEGLTSDGADALMDNLGFESVDSFSKKMENNLLNARDDFQRAIAVKIEMGIKPSELVIKDGAKKATKEIYKNKEVIVKEIGEKVDEYIKTRLEDYKGVDARAIKLEAVGLLLGNGNLGAGASFDISKLDLFFDSLQAGFINVDGKIIPGIVISKEILSEKGFNVTGSLVNGFIPSLSASYTTKPEIDKFKKLFPNEIKSKVSLSAYASISPLLSTKGFIGGGGVIGVAFNRVDENTSEGIEAMTDKMAGLLDKVAGDLENGKSFAESSFYKISENKNRDAKIYNEMKVAYDTYAKGQEYSDSFLKDMMQGYLAYYKTGLYNNAEGIKVTSIGGGLAFLPGFLPIPYLTIGGEYINNDWKEIIHSINEEREITHKTIDINKIGTEETIYNGKKVLSIPKGNEYIISNSKGPTQSEIVGDNLYISGDISNITIDEYTTHNGVIKTIVIGKGMKDSNGLYKQTGIVDINSSIEGGSIPSKEIAAYDKKAIETTKPSRDNLFNIIQTDALNHPKTIGMQKLQRMVFNYKKTGTPDLKLVWEQFINVINYKGFKEYAKEKGSEKQVDELINNIKSIKSDSEKILIVQSVSSNFMKKEFLLKNKDETISVEGNKTIEKIDRKRNGFFDRQFTKDFPSLLPQIQAAREQWYASNGNAKKYNFTPISDGSIAFTGVESITGNHNINVKGIMPYTGAYNIASIDGGKDFTPIEGKSKEVINGIPNNALKNIQKILNANGENLKSIEDVKNFINDGGDDSISIDYKLAFCKMGECLNDSVVLKDLTIIKDGKQLQIGLTSTSEVYDPKNEAVKVGIVLTGDSRKKSKNKGKNTSTPGIEPGSGDSSTPGVDTGSDVGGGGIGGGNDSTGW